jgi:signal transduction histidine kinase
MIRTIRRNVQQLDELVQNVLKESAHIQTETGVRLERRRLDLWPLVEALIHDLRPVAGTASTRLINAIPEDFSVYADASLLRRIFQNLIANAIKYTPRGRVVIAAHRPGPHDDTECSVSDDGSGIPRERLNSIFEKGDTDPDRDDGTGLGLTIVKTFVEAHGGHVSVESREGVGATFRFLLPGPEGLRNR